MYQTKENIPNNTRERNYKDPYNKWIYENTHLKTTYQGQKMYMIDVDGLQCRGERFVVLLENRRTDSPLNPYQHKMLIKLAKALKIPAYIVHYSWDLKSFRVVDMRTGQKKEQNAEDHINWLRTFE